MAKKHKDRLKGGRADSKSPDQFESKQLKKGTKHEMEHTKDKAVAREIAMDHLAEDSKYYDKLEQMEGKNMEKKKQESPAEKAEHLKHPQMKKVDQKKLQNCEAKHLHHPQIKYDWSK